jgi:hypothetical protein
LQLPLRIDRVFEAELRESLKSIASKNCTVELDGIVEFDTRFVPNTKATANPSRKVWEDKAKASETLCVVKANAFRALSLTFLQSPDNGRTCYSNPTEEKLTHENCRG